MTNARFWVLITLASGLLIHITRLIVGVDQFQQMFTWQMDIVLSIPMILSFLFMVREWTFHMGNSTTERRTFIFTLIYFAISLPLHIRSYFAHNLDILAYVPYWYGFIFLIYVTILIILWWRIKNPEKRT